jgi:hypothetical protein
LLFAGLKRTVSFFIGAISTRAFLTSRLLTVFHVISMTYARRALKAQ